MLVVALAAATAAATFDPEIDQHVGAIRESEAGGMRGRNLWTAVFFAAGFLGIAATLFSYVCGLAIGLTAGYSRSLLDPLPVITQLSTRSLACG